MAAADKNKQKIVELILKSPGQSSDEIYSNIKKKVAKSTVKRYLKELIGEERLRKEGASLATRYYINEFYEFIVPISTERYFKVGIDDRIIKEGFNWEAIRNIIPNHNLINNEERAEFYELDTKFKAKIADMSTTIYRKEFERLAIDLSWKSSQIEGNTYSLLETELLLKEKIEAKGKKKEEATMLLNHKNALDYILEHNDIAIPLTIRDIEDMHSILIKDLNVERNIRSRSVGITGTNYAPLANEHQIREALQLMCDLINAKENAFEKSLLALLLISYIQPFEDGNKRTARIVSNAILANNKICPLSYRTIDPIDYKEALLIFYERNNLFNFKKMFIEQYKFAIKTYFK